MTGIATPLVRTIRRSCGVGCLPAWSSVLDLPEGGRRMPHGQTETALERTLCGI